MISQMLNNVIGISCQEFRSPNGTEMAFIVHPFRFMDGDPILVYSKFASQTEIEFFDDCETLTQITSTNGLNISQKDFNEIQTICDHYSVKLKDGRMSLQAPIENASVAFSTFMRSILEIDAKICGKGAAGDITAKQSLIQYATPKLLSIDADLMNRKKVAYTGITGNKYFFDFNVCSKYEVDAISASPIATASTLRKLADIMSIPANNNLFEPTVIIDDLTNESKFIRESKILSNEMIVVPLSKLDNWKPRIHNYS